MYQCEICGATFDEPFVCTDRRPDADGFSEILRYEKCPVCGEPYFAEPCDFMSNEIRASAKLPDKMGGWSE